MFALEYQARFISEERTKRYPAYREGVPEEKIVPGAKNILIKRALLGLLGCGATCSLSSVEGVIFDPTMCMASDVAAGVLFEFIRQLCVGLQGKGEAAALTWL